ncbi:hypothetical protein APHAL10511_008372 [Amanita phalloides]|nr:hypothetical protein APHAL10511_008372 [Amanita phalloides]
MRSFLLLAACAPLRALAWGSAGHEIIATIAQIHLHPSAYPSVCSILNSTSHDPSGPPCHLAPVASWADRIRFKYHWSGPLHYIGAFGDHPRETCLFPGDRGWEGRQDANILGATRNMTNQLTSYVAKTKLGGHVSTEDTEEASQALKFLIHFLGDLHQPLHLTGRDRGGNSDKVVFDGRQTNLHSVWDSKLIAKAIRSTPRKYNHPLPDERIEYSLRGAIYDPYVRQIMTEGVLHDWARDIPDWLECPARQQSSGDKSGEQRVLSDEGDPGANTDDDVLCPYSWAKPIHALNCDIIWPKELDEVSLGGRHRHPHHEGPELDTPEYAGVIAREKLIERLLAQAGVRLAHTLNLLFAEE